MAEKISTIILKVDLECDRCYKKIRKVLCKLQDKVNIKTISFDEKGKTVTISGPFDPEKVSKKLCCQAGNVIKEMQIKENKDNKEKDNKPKDQKPVEKEKPASGEKEKPASGEKEKPNNKPSKPEKEDKPEKEAKPGQAEPEVKLKTKPFQKMDFVDLPMASKAGPEPPKGEPVMMANGLVAPAVWPNSSVCCFRPAYEAYYGGSRCYSCGKVSGWMTGGPPEFYGGPMNDGYRGYNFSCEEDPNAGCSIM